jgi:ElaB/YqjD/DUF883 family membrane-anchored ribosome-binding protein
MSHLLVMLASVLIGCCLLLTGCPSTPARQQDPPPAAADVLDLAAREKAAGLAAAEAAAKGDDQEAEYQRRLAAAIKPLREAAEDRQRSQQADMDAIAARERAAARKDAEAEQLAKDRRWSMIGVAGCAAVLVALLVMGVPPLWAIGLPSAGATGLIVLAGLSSVPWLATAVGLALACLVLVGLAGLLVYVAREWLRWAADRDRMPRDQADAASIARQPRPLRWLVSRLLGAA